MDEREDMPIITAKIGSRQRRLSTPKQWRVAIANNDLTRETQIEYQLGLRKAEMLAGACPELQPLFDELLGPLAAAPPPPPPSPPPQATEPPVEGLEANAAEKEPDALEDAPEPDELAEPDLEPAPPRRQIADPRPERKRSDGFWTTKTLGIAAVAGIALVIILSSGNDSESPAAEPVAPASTMAAPVEVQSTRFYTRRSLQVHAQPFDSAPTLRPLGRGEEVFGVYDTTARWIRLTAGSGGFVPSSALQDNPPPPLDGTTADDYFALEPAPILSAPTYGSPELGTLAAGTKVSVFGSVNNEFAEYALDDGSIGYVRWDAFGGIGGKGRRGWLEISNRCDVYKNLAFSLMIDGERVNRDVFWTFSPGMTDSISFDGEARIEVDGAELYYRDLGEDFHLEPQTRVIGLGIDQVLVNGVRKEMKRLVPVATDAGAYRITFC